MNITIDNIKDYTYGMEFGDDMQNEFPKFTTVIEIWPEPFLVIWSTSSNGKSSNFLF